MINDSNNSDNKIGGQKLKMGEPSSMRHSGIFSKMKARLSMSFTDRNKEEKFLSQQRDNTAEHLRWACLVGALIMIGFLWQDTFISETSYKAIIIRIFGALPVTALAWYLSRNLVVRRFISYISAFFWLSYACFTAAIFISYGPGAYGLTSSIGLGSFLLILFGVLAFSNLRLWASILVGLSTLLVYAVSVALWTEAVFFDFIMGDFLTAVALMIGLDIKTLFTERAQRRQFETSELLHQSYSVVEQQVQERTAELQVTNTILTAEITERKRVEESLRINELRFRQISESAHEWIWEVDSNGKFTYVSPIIKDLLGYEAEEIIGIKYFYDFFDPENREEIKQAALGTFARKEPFRDFINCNIHKDGRSIILSSTGIPILDKENNLIGYRGVDVDITERLRAEEALKKSEESFRNLVDNALVGVYKISFQGNIIWANQAMMNIVEYDGDDYTRLNVIDFYKNPGERDELARILKEKGEMKNYETELISYKGKSRNVNINMKIEGSVIAGMLLDITERKQAENALIKNKNQYEVLVSKIPVGIYILRSSPSGSFALEYVSSRMVEITGVRAEDLLEDAALIFQSIHADDRDEFVELNREGIEQMRPFNWKGRFIVNGCIKWLHVESKPELQANGDVLWHGMITDITDRKKAEEELYKRGAYLSAIIENQPGLVWLKNTEGCFLAVNNTFVASCGKHSAADVVGKTDKDIWSPELAEKYRKDDEQVLRNAKPISVEELIVDKGEEKWFETFKTPVKDLNGKVIGTTGFARDITERKLAEEKLLRSETEFRILAESMPQMVWITRPDGWNIYFNQQWMDYTGMTLEESYGHGWSKPFHPDDQQLAWDAWQNATKNNDVYSIESRLRRADGVYNWFLVRGVPILDANGTILKWFGTCTDINEIKSTEKELIISKERAEESDKLKSEFLNQMSHEIRTPINIILGNTDYLNDLMGKNMDPDTRDCFHGIGLASTRIIRTIDLILNAAEFKTSGYLTQLVKIDLDSEILNKLYKEHELSAKQKGLEIKYICNEKETNVIADNYSITQIFANLIDNAIKYTKKGKVEILLEKNKTGKIMVEIKDTGIGMNKEFLSKMFEPFTQEEQGSTRSYDGNGLGLALVKNYCDINNAVVEVESEKNVGTTFRVIFK